jgi:hypothetical protein
MKALALVAPRPRIERTAVVELTPGVFTILRPIHGGQEARQPVPLALAPRLPRTPVILTVRGCDIARTPDDVVRHDVR